MPLPHGWDHQAIASKLRALQAEGINNPKERYAIAMDSARHDWRHSNGSAPMPGHLKKAGGVGARRNRTDGGGKLRAFGQGIPASQASKVNRQLKADGLRLATPEENGNYYTVLIDDPEFGPDYPKKVWVTNRTTRSPNQAMSQRDLAKYGEAPRVYRERQKEISRLLRVIKADMKKHAAEEKKTPSNWGWAGDLGYVIEKLKEASLSERSQ